MPCFRLSALFRCGIKWLDVDMTYPSATLEENRFVARSRRVGKRADGIGRLVLVSSQEVVQPLVANGLHKPFASEWSDDDGK